MNLKCPSCAGVLPPPIGTRKISCGYCGKKLYYKAEDFVPRFLLKGSAKGDIRAEAEKLFGSKILHEGIKGEAVLVSRRKRFIPFYLITGKRGGVMEIGKERVVQANTYNLNSGTDDYMGNAYRRNKPEVVVEEDSRVTLGDFRYIYEAARVEEAETAQDFIRRSILANLSDIEPVDLQELSSGGEVIAPDIPKETIIEKGVMSARGGEEGLEVLGISISIVYYPVEELLFRFRDNFFTVTFDLVEGRFLWGRMPCKRNAVVIVALIFAALLGFFFGRFVKLFLLPFSMIKADLSFFVYFGSIAFLAASLFFGGGLNIAYLLLKTQFEARVTPHGLHVNRWGEVPKTFLTPYLKGIIKFFSEGFEEAAKRMDR